MIPCALFEAEHDEFRKCVRRFFETEFASHYPVLTARVPRRVVAGCAFLVGLSPDHDSAMGGIR